MNKDNFISSSWESKLSKLLDSQFTIPGTKIRFGIDGLLGLIPGIGDAITNFFGLLIIGSAINQGVPLVVIARMISNSLIDSLLGAIPIAGDIFDLFFRSNKKNLYLLQSYTNSPHEVKKRSLIIVLSTLLICIAGFSAAIYGLIKMINFFIVKFT